MKRRNTIYVIVMLITSLLLPASGAGALSDAQRKAFDYGLGYFNTEESNACTLSQSSTPSTSITPGSVYFIGDSIGHRAADELSKRLGSGGWSYVNRAVDNRSLVNGNENLSGWDQINDSDDPDVALVSAARAVVIELGTNSSGFTPENVQKMVSRVHEINGAATIYWIDTAVVNRTDTQVFDNINKIIYGQSGIKVIPWSKEVFGQSADPTKMEGLSDSNGYIEIDGSVNAHPTYGDNGGVKAYAEMVEKAVKGSTNTAAQAGPVYLVGDSLTYRTEPDGSSVNDRLEDAFSGSWSFMGKSISGRALATVTSGVSPDGLGQINQTEDDIFIRSASAVVIELGTNYKSYQDGKENFTAENVQKMITAIRSKNEKAAIYWIDTAVVNSPDPNGYHPDAPAGLNAVNKIIYDESQKSGTGFHVISWNKTVFGESANPTNDMTGQAEPDAHKYIVTGEDDWDVHLTGAGKTTYTNMIVNAVKSGTNSSQPGNSGASCTCSVPDISDPGNPAYQDLIKLHKKQIWSYFLDKGLKPWMIAGIMGNMMTESAGTFDGRIVQRDFPNTRNEISVLGKPSSLDDNVPFGTIVRDGETLYGGYGIVQWTSLEYKNNLRDLAVMLDTKPGDLRLQLDYLWGVTTGEGFQGKGAGDEFDFVDHVMEDVRKTTTSDEASKVFLQEFERPLFIDGNGDGEDDNVYIRRNFAAAILADPELSGITQPTFMPVMGSSAGCQGGPQIVAGSTYNIPCAAGTDVSPEGGADGYKSGKLYKIRICRIQDTIVNSQLSGYVETMYNDINKETGVKMNGWSFRTMDQQIALRKSNGCPDIYTSPSSSCVVPTARPGFSNHQMGLAIDITCNGTTIPRFPVPGTNKCYDWLVINSSKYGLIEFCHGNRGCGSYEGWHWSTTGG